MYLIFDHEEPKCRDFGILDFRYFKDTELFKCLNFLKAMGLEQVGMFFIVISILIHYLGGEQEGSWFSKYVFVCQ